MDSVRGEFCQRIDQEMSAVSATYTEPVARSHERQFPVKKNHTADVVVVVWGTNNTAAPSSFVWLWLLTEYCIRRKDPYKKRPGSLSAKLVIQHVQVAELEQKLSSKRNITVI